jgi:hypothetical protein
MMKKIVFLLLFVADNVAAQTWIWENHGPKSLTTDSIAYPYKNTFIGYDSNIYVVHNAWFNTTDPEKASIAMYTPEGNFAWKKYYPFRISNIEAAGSGDIFVATGFSEPIAIGSSNISPVGDNDILLIKMDWEGNITDYKTFGSASSETTGGLCIQGNDIIVSGSYGNTLYIDSDSLVTNGGNNAFLLRFDSSLNLEDKFTTECTSCSAWSIDSDNNGNLYFLAAYSGNLNFVDTSFNGGSAIIMLKVDSTFTPMAKKTLNSWVGGSYNYYFRTDHANNVILYECLQYTSSGYGNTIVKLNSNLNFVWECTRFTYPLGEINSPIGFDIDQQNNIYFTGYDHSYYSGRPERSLIGKFHPMGMLTWLITDTLSTPAFPYDITVKSQDQFYINGSHKDSTHIGPFNFYGEGEFIAFYGLSTVGIKESAQSSSFNIYPNPSNGIFKISSTERTDQLNVCVYDLLGNCVFTKAIAANEEEIDLSAQAKGFYLLEIRSDKEKSTGRIVLQ